MTEGSGRYGVRRSTAAQAHFNNRILRVCLFTEAAPVRGVLGGRHLRHRKKRALMWVKFLRVYGGCLGAKGRRRAWQGYEKPRLAA